MKIGSNRPRRSSSRYVKTRSGKVLKINRSIGERVTAMKEAKSRRKVERLRGLPKSRFKRLVWRLNPRRLAAFWFSRDGAVMALKITGFTILALFILVLGVFAYFRKDLPDISVTGAKLGGSISYYDRSGQVLLWQDYDAIKRVPVASNEISQYVKDATIAIEDRDFYDHRGFDVKGIGRAAINDVFRKSGGLQGGSTITQQLVKLNENWTQERTISRKFKEIILAVELERSYTKDEILSGYLNSAPYGSIDYGVQAAASDYFHKPAKDLTLPESAMLAAIPKSPGVYSPYNKEYFDREAFIGRYNYVLDSMVEIGRLKKEDAEAAKKVDILASVLPQQTKYAGIKFPYFTLAAKRELTSKFAPEGGAGSTRIGGWKVTTTLEVGLQNLAEQEVAKGMDQVRRQGGDVAAFAAEDVKTGQMVALIGGIDFTNKEFGELNYAQTPLPPGSSFKPYNYTAMIENNDNVGAGSVLYDLEQPLPGYPCTNKSSAKNGGNCLHDYDLRSPGPVTLRYALGGSRNIPAVKAFLSTGSEKVIKTAESLGLKSGYKCYLDVELTKTTECYGAAAIGDGAFLHLDEHVNGLASLSRLGAYLDQTYILKIQDAVNKPIFEWKQPKAEQVIRPDTAYIVNDMLSDPNASYFGKKTQRFKGWNFAFKTGTTNDAKDGWMMGYSTKYAAGVWVGYHSRQRAMSGAMENMTQPIMNGWMTGSHTNEKPVNWTMPSGVQKLPAFVVKNHVGFGSIEPSPSTDLFPSWYKPKSTSSPSATIDRVSNKVATSCTPPRAKETAAGNSNAEQFSADIYYGSGAAARGGVSANDDVHSCSDATPTTPTVTGPSTCDVSVECLFTITVQQGTHPFNDSQHAQFPGMVNLILNGQIIKSTNIADSACTGSPAVCTVTISYTPGPEQKDQTLSFSANAVDSVLYESPTSSVLAVKIESPSDEPPPVDEN